jgi:tetratricopeptide (TPR) repeat protein
MEAVAVMLFLIIYAGLLLAFGAHKTPLMRDEKRYQTGIRLVENQKYTEALVYFDNVLQKKPNSALAWSYKAECHWAMKEYYQCIVACNRALRIDYSVRDCYLFRGVANYELEEWEDALADFEKAVWHFREKHPEAFKYRGLTHYQLGHYEKASQDYARAFALGDEEAYYLMHHIKAKNSQP